MAGESILDRNIRIFRELVQNKGWTIISENEIQSGHQFRVTNGQDKIPVNFYATGKVLIQGKSCSLQAYIQTWWQNLATSPGAMTPPDLVTPSSQSPVGGRTARFYVAQDRFERVKQLLMTIEAQVTIQEPTPDPHQLFRAEIRVGSERVMASQFRTGTLLVQGKTSTLFEQVCTTLESILSQPFAERGARYIPDSEREEALEYLNRPEAEREALDWTYEHLGQEVFEFLPGNEREGYLSGASILLWLKASNRRLLDYSTVVMPFARAYEGFVIRLAIHLGIVEESKIGEIDADKIRAGSYLDQVRDKIVKTDKSRFEGLAYTLLGAWRDIRNKVLHSDPLNPPPHRSLFDAENDIATLNRAMYHGYEYLVERGIIIAKQPRSSEEEYVTLAADTERLREQLDRDGYKINSAPGAQWIAQLGDIKVICPIGSSGNIKVSGPQRTVFERTYRGFLTNELEKNSTPEIASTIPSSQPQVTGLARIGLDESGKGDYFGPLVIGAVYVDESTEEKLLQIGVRDSKRITDNHILELAEEIKLLCPHSIVPIGPKRYNELYDEIKNLNVLLAWGHARALENLLGSVDCDLAVADQFGNESFLLNALLKKGRKIKLEQRPKAEQDVAVAAASILARAEFVHRMLQLSKRVGRSLPKGSSDPKIITIGQEIVRKGGQSALAELAKLHFKTTQVIIK